MGLPRKLKNFNLSIDGTSYLGEATEFTQPKLTMKLEEFRSGGMNGAVEVNMGMEKLQARRSRQRFNVAFRWHNQRYNAAFQWCIPT